MTARDLITRAFRFTHIVGAGEDPTNDEAKDGLEVMNELIEQTAIVKLLAFFRTEVVFPTVSGKFSYTIGPASTIPDVVAPRPVELLSGFTRRPTGNAQPVDLPIFIGAKQDYDNIQSKFVQVNGWEQAAYYEASFPKGKVFLYQVPVDNASEIHLTVSAQLSPFATIDDEVLLPPGYNQWLRYTLGKHLAPEYGMQWTASMDALQIGAEEMVKSNNIRPFPITGSGVTALSSKPGAGSYNVFSDTVRGTK